MTEKFVRLMKGKIQFGTVCGGSANTAVPPWIGVPPVGTPGGAEVDELGVDEPLLGAVDPLLDGADDDELEDDALVVAAGLLPHAASVIPAMARTATIQRAWCAVLRMVVHPTLLWAARAPGALQTGFIPHVA